MAQPLKTADLRMLARNAYTIALLKAHDTYPPGFRAQAAALDATHRALRRITGQPVALDDLLKIVAT